MVYRILVEEFRPAFSSKDESRMDRLSEVK
jgi:hypothetical protein